MNISTSTNVLDGATPQALFEDFFRIADAFADMQQEHQAALFAGNCKEILSWQQSRERAFRGLARILERVVACGDDKAELSSLPAQTKLIPIGCKAELSSLPAQTKLIPSGCNKGCIARVREILEKLLADEDVLQKLILARQLKVQEQIYVMRKGREALHGYNINKGLVPRPRYLSNRM